MSSSLQMTQGPFLGKVIRYTIPIVLTGILQLAFNAADLIIVGQFAQSGDLSVAAVGSTGSINSLIIGLFTGLSVGSGVAMAQAVGSGNTKSIQNAVHTAIPTALVSGVFLMLIGVLFSSTFLKWMGTPDSVIGLATSYMQIYFAGILGPLVYNFGASILRAIGDTKSPLIFLSTAGVINVALNSLFVIVFHMDVAGVALATVLSQFYAAIMVLRKLSGRTDACRLDLRKLRFHKGSLKKIVLIGLPSGIQGALFSISNVVMQSSFNSLGEAVVAGNSAAASIEGFLYTSVNSFHQAAVNFTGQNVGARRLDNIPKILGSCIACGSMIGAALGLVLFLAGRPLLSLYIPGAEQAIEYGLVRMTFLYLPYFLLALYEVPIGILRGLGVSFTPTIASFICVCGLRLTWVYTVFAHHRTSQTLYVAYPLSWFLTATAELVILFIVLKKRTKHYAKFNASNA